MAGFSKGKVKGSAEAPAEAPAVQAPPVDSPPAEVPPVEGDHAGQLLLEGTPPVQELQVRVRRRRTKAEMAAARGGPVLSRDQVAADKALLDSAFDGTFAALAMALGEHWRLNPEGQTVDGARRPAESAILADVWQPVMERYGGKITGEAMMWLSASTVTVALVVPRVRQSVQKRSGVIGWIQAKIEARRQRRGA
jgi:hypothetical protein